MQNWSYDGLFGMFPNSENLERALALNKTVVQTDENGMPYKHLPQDQNKFLPHDLPNEPVNLKPLIDKKRMPPSEITHRYFHEIYQINNGSMDKFVQYSSSKGLAMSYYDVSDQYFGKLAKEYTVLDNFFHSAFGGSFLNHQWLISAQTPTYPKEILEGNETLRELLVATFDDNGFVKKDLPIYHYEEEYYAVNHIESVNLPHNPRTSPHERMPPYTHRNIGDVLSDAGISWKWYAGGYDDALRGNATMFQYHHQPFVFYERFKDPESRDRREHLRDEKDLLRDLEIGNCPKISFYKPYGELNFHPNMSDIDIGQKKLEEIVSTIQKSQYWDDALIVITFDENGGRWDHIPPPKGDMWGPGSRVPAVLVSPHVKKGHVDSTQFETLSIMRFIENMLKLNETLIPPTRKVNCLCSLIVPGKGKGFTFHPLILIAPICIAVAIMVSVIIYFIGRMRKKNSSPSINGYTPVYT